MTIPTRDGDLRKSRGGRADGRKSRIEIGPQQEAEGLKKEEISLIDGLGLRRGGVGGGGSMQMLLDTNAKLMMENVAAAAEQRAAHHAKGGARLSWGDHTSKTSLDRSLFDKHPDDNAFPAADIGQSQHSAADSVMWNSLHEDVMFKGICGDVDRGGGPSREQRAA
mmetsp:Transcript_33453/g.71308  ORF Transcript_33453/g.71308 Transcript_33453/m.71308 type:complete len:166 (+) Transcript_33453:382-879(+)